MQAVPRTPYDRNVLATSDTLRGRRPCIHWVAPSTEEWLDRQRSAGRRVLAAELADGATPLPRLGAATGTTVVLLGHEHHGVPDDVLADIDECVEIPMAGWGASLNVAVAGGLVLYRLAGLM
ncbi:TrmH family RNA methyltransferase [Myceligenerans pegani]|uniref:TrmH family RNA methyltransferase n=1 Tax=Myceligenerans pegani TaxID=2776917 RepID=UPI00299EF83F|nr:TrmH family RNA methyltransferase [Myceligenerans sp. TRM 65318]